MSELDVGVTDPRVATGNGWSACTARGATRARNADSFAVSDSGPSLAFAVADGVGAMDASPFASDAAVSAIVSWVDGRAEIDERDFPRLFTAIDGAVAQELRRRGAEGATTLAFAIVSGSRCVVASVGDSEIVTVSKTGSASRINILDHVPARPNTLLAWIDGATKIEPHIISLESLPYRLCLITDGVVQTVNYDDLTDVVRSASINDAAQALVALAQGRGSTDDVTALVIGSEVKPSGSRSTK